MIGIAHVERSVEICGRQKRTVTRFYSAKGDVTATMSVTGPYKKKSGLMKKPPYNYKQLSSQLMRARNSGAVSQVLIKMRNKRAQLISAKRDGSYDETELALAIIHAEAIEQVAKKRKKNLEIEEKAELVQENEEYEEQLMEAADPLGLFGGDDENSRKLSEEEMEQILSDLEEEMDELMKEMEENARLDESLDEMTEVLSGDISPEDLEAMKKKHRADEQRDIIKADMKYLKALFDKLSREKEHASSTPGVSSRVDSILAAPAADMPQVAPSSGTVSAAIAPSSEGQLIDISI
ncbi:MAG: hypothetical protein K6C95_03925 [Lachnospiraceae bacterium]|nr:hypothetical protein [Lachnospiraceae bacterium]